MPPFQKGNTVGGRTKGAKNRYTTDVRQVFFEVYENMGANKVSSETGKPLTGAEAMLDWARDNPTEFYRLYGKMIPTTQEITGDVHEDFLEMLVLKEHSRKAKMIEAKANVVDVGNEGPIELDNGEEPPHVNPSGEGAPDKDRDLV